MEGEEDVKRLFSKSQSEYAKEENVKEAKWKMQKGTRRCWSDDAEKLDDTDTARQTNGYTKVYHS